MGGEDFSFYGQIVPDFSSGSAPATKQKASSQKVTRRNSTLTRNLRSRRESDGEHRADFLDQHAQTQ
jgi:hypothetical protein